MPSMQFSRKHKHEEIVAMLMRVSEVAKPISPQRAAALALELSHMSMTREEIEQGCKRYAASVASQFREIQLSDFTNSTITSERELREAVKELERREAELQSRMNAFGKEVEKRVEQRLQEIEIELKAISSHYPSQTVIAARALYEAKVALEAQKRREIEALIPKMINRLNEVYERVSKSNDV